MVEWGFQEDQIGISKHSLTYAGWELGGTEHSKLYILPFKTNVETYIEPANPAFLSELRALLKFPRPNEPFGRFWHGPGRYMTNVIPPNF